MDRREILGGDFSAPTERCEQIRPFLSLYVDRMASAEEVRAIELHLAGCKDCDSAYEWMLVTHDVLASRPCAVPPADMSLRIRAAIEASREAETRQTVRFRTIYRPAFALAASAIIAAVTFGIFHHGTRPGGAIGPVVATRPNIGPTVNSHPIVSPHATVIQPRAHTIAAEPPHVSTPKIKTPVAAHHNAPPALIAKVPVDDTDISAPPTVSADRSHVHLAPVHEVASHVLIKPHALPLVAAVPRPAPHKQPSVSPVRHPDVVATSRVPETHVPQEETPAPVVTRPEPAHSMVVATVPEPPVSGGGGLLADVQGHVKSMSHQRAYNDSFRVSGSGGDIRMASYETPTDIGNHGESISGTQAIAH